MPVISTTISTADFDLVPQTTIPSFLLPIGSNDIEFTACVSDAGAEVDSYLDIFPGLSTTWEFFPTTGSYTAAASRSLDRPLSMWWVANKNQS